MSTNAQAVFLLGDIFEVWIGDDARHQPFEASCIAILREASLRLDLFFMAGNRDFLLGEQMLTDSDVSLLADPTVLIAFGQRYLLSHGDAQCVDDRPYQAFRAQVRSRKWQDEFLAKPLLERRALARQMRDASQAQQASPDQAIDLDAATCVRMLQQTGCKTLIHGHTHRPGFHALGELESGLQRQVLSDWDFDVRPSRGDLLRLTSTGLQRISLV